MRSTQQRVEAVQKRAEELKRKNARRAYTATVIGSGCASVAIIVLLAVLVPSAMENTFDTAYGQPILFASMFSNPQSIGYVVIGVLSFLLGVSVTLLCVMMKKKRDQNGR